MANDDSTPTQSGLLLALVNPVAGQEEAFLDWYWNTHIPEVLALPGFISAQRYNTAAEADEVVSHRYGTIYEVEGPAAEARNMLFGAGLGMSPTLDLSTMLFLPLTATGQPILG